MKRRRLRIVIPAFPAFNIYSRIAKRTTALGPVCVATSVNELEGWDVEVIDENNLGRYGPRDSARGADHELIQQQRPADVVGFYGGLTSTVPRLYDLAQWYRRAGVVTIAGGQHFAGQNTAEALQAGVDYVVFGEGEQTIGELLRAIESNADVGHIPGIAYLKNGHVIHTPARDAIADFDRLPYPDFSLVRYARIKIFPIERIRGCCMNCEFCTVKGTPRCASAERLLGNISHLVETHNARKFFIVDDLFGQQREETLRFCRLFADYQEQIGRQLITTVQIRLDKARDPELLAAMRKAGILNVAIGFESPIDEELKAMNKAVRANEMLSLARTFHRFGFLIHGMFIFGYPLSEGVTFTMSVNERVKRFRRFIRKAKIDTIQVLLPVPLPGTELRHRLEGQGRIYPIKDVGWEYYDGNFPLFEPDEPATARALQAGGKRIMSRVYDVRYALLVVAGILSFPTIALSLHNIQKGWQRWYRRWSTHVTRFGGWLTMRQWTAQFKQDAFVKKLHRARCRLAHVNHPEPLQQEMEQPGL